MSSCIALLCLQGGLRHWLSEWVREMWRAERRWGWGGERISGERAREREELDLSRKHMLPSSPMGSQPHHVWCPCQNGHCRIWGNVGVGADWLSLSLNRKHVYPCQLATGIFPDSSILAPLKHQLYHVKTTQDIQLNLNQAIYVRCASQMKGLWSKVVHYI